MKKYFLMLVVALAMPLLFTSCGDDDDEPGFPYELPNLNWGSSMDNVKMSMNHGLLHIAAETETSIVYFTNAREFPAYVYTFADGGLNTSSLALSDAQDTEYHFQGMLEKKYGKAYDEDDEGYYYADKNNEVYYGYNEEIDGWMATWTPKTKGGKSVVKDAAKANLELLKEARK